jgi:CRP-like cAMP-binding protein
MKLNPEEMRLLLANPLFRNVSEKDIPEALTCLSARKKPFSAGSYLFEEGDKADFAVILLSGDVDLFRYTYQGNASLLESFASGELFGEAYALREGSTFGVSALARKGGNALFLKLSPLFQSLGCPFASPMIRNLVGSLSDKVLLMKQKLTILSQRGLEDRVLLFLSSFSEGKERFEIPYSREEMAAYLGCDRSALSRLLSAMREKGILSFEGRSFYLPKKSREREG